MLPAACSAASASLPTTYTYNATRLTTFLTRRGPRSFHIFLTNRGQTLVFGELRPFPPSLSSFSERQNKKYKCKRGTLHSSSHVPVCS